LAGAVGPALPATAVIAAVAADEGGYAVKLSDDCPLDGRFEIGSMTKTMTGTVLASLVNDRTVEFRDPAAEPIAADDRVISRTAADAATLLQNSGHALPLTPAALSSLALIGPGADQVIGTGPSDGSGAGTAQPPGTLQVLRQDLVSDPVAHLSFAVPSATT
jgi:hypothetical protein